MVDMDSPPTSKKGSCWLEIEAPLNGSARTPYFRGELMLHMVD